ncbi:hypothetical protein pipiens_003537 [Culex pipiens pipiens]|uniref:Uncharacterized protein n=1 Tax=Culex pipiens pipiens TaxID=38569 RepID=A0ABD1CWN3_CULPP
MVNKTDSNDHEPTNKKRRNLTSVTGPYLRSKEEIFFRQNTVAFEEQEEAAKRSPEADSKLFQATCDELRKLFDEIVTLKKEGAASEEVQGRLRRSGSRVRWRGTNGGCVENGPVCALLVRELYEKPEKDICNCRK